MSKQHKGKEGAEAVHTLQLSPLSLWPLELHKTRSYSPFLPAGPPPFIGETITERGVDNACDIGTQIAGPGGL